MPTVNLMLGDCLERMAEIESGSVDAVVADPPYGSTACTWDQAPDWPKWWLEAERLCKPDAFVALFTAMPSALDMIAPVRNLFCYDLIVHKNLSTGFLDANKRPLRNHELIWIFRFGKPKWNRIDWPRDKMNRQAGTLMHRGDVSTEVYGVHKKRTQYTYGVNECPKSVISMRRKGNFHRHARGEIHPTQKSVSVMEWLIKSYSPEGGTVIDSWMGSGTTGVASVNTGRHFIGIERDPGYFAIAERRIHEAANSMPLFTAPSLEKSTEASSFLTGPVGEWSP